MSAVQDALESAYEACRRRRLKIVRVRSRRPITAGIVATYFSGRLTGKKTFARVRRQIIQVGRLYVERLWNLGRHGAWLYQRGLSAAPDEIEIDRLVRAFKLAAQCTPRSVIYSRPLKYAKACNRANFCPYCWEAATARQIQLVRQVINKLAHAADAVPFNLRARIVEFFVPAPDLAGDELATPDERYAAVLVLRAQLDVCKQYLQQQQKLVRRNTFGSIWRIVVVPAANGWQIQVRQLWLTSAAKNFSVVTLPCSVARVTYDKTAEFACKKSWRTRKTTDDIDTCVYNLTIAFNTYPMSWLTEDIDLVAVYLNAAAKTRLIGGTGLFRKVGSGLVRQCIALEAEEKRHDSTPAAPPARYPQRRFAVR